MLAREALDEYRAEVPAPAHELAADLCDSGAEVEADPHMLKVVLRHLLANASQALFHQERGRIEVRVYADEAEVCCEVRYPGEGLPTADWEAMFAPFYSTKGPFAGEAGHAAADALGLGLTVSRHLVRLHGGRLEFRSASGQGTIARLALPRSRGDAGPTPCAERERLRADGPAPAPGPHSKQDAGSRV